MNQNHSSPMSPEQARAHIEYVGKILAKSGFLQTEALKHPEHGPKLKELIHKSYASLADHAIDTLGADPQNGKEHSISHANACRDVTIILLNFVVENLADCYNAFSSLPMEALFNLPDEADTESAKPGDELTRIQVSPTPLLDPIIHAAVNISGGQEQFLQIQKNAFVEFKDLIDSCPPHRRGGFILSASICKAFNMHFGSRSEFVGVATLVPTVIGNVIRDMIFMPTFQGGFQFSGVDEVMGSMSDHIKTRSTLMLKLFLEAQEKMRNGQMPQAEPEASAKPKSPAASFFEGSKSVH